MLMKKSTKIRRFKGIFAGFLIALMVLSFIGQAVVNVSSVYAEPDGDPVPSAEAGATNENTTSENTTNVEVPATTENNTNSTTATEDSTDTSSETTKSTSSSKASVNLCKKSMGSLGWIVCPLMEKITEAVDWIYDKIEGILTVSPIKAEDGSPIYEIWKWCLAVANIAFIIFLLVVIYSQLTGWGINNYGIKKILPKLIVTVILVNLSFLICSLLVDVSNIIGAGLRGVFQSVEQTALANMGSTADTTTTAVAMAEVYTSMAGGAALAVGAGVIAFETGTIWMLIPVVLGAIVAVATGLLTIALRQAVVILLVMIAPLAFVANLLPNTEPYFQKWKKLLERMLVFYPMFSLLFGASQLAGFAIIMSAKDGFMLLLGLAVQIFPLFFSWKLMQMSGTFLGDINAKLRALAARPVAGSRAWAEQKKQQTSLNRLVYGRTPMSHLRRYMDNKKALEEKHMENLQTIRKNQANIFVQRTIGAGYDGTKAKGTDGDLKPNKYTKTARNVSNSNMESEMTTKDTAHVIHEYGKYFVRRDIRERADAAVKRKDEAELKRLRAIDPEYRRSSIGGKNFLELSRAEMTEENDNENDFNFMVGQFLEANEAVDKNGKTLPKYDHYIRSSAGGLGNMGTTRVLGKIIAKAAAVESNQRRDISIIMAKYPPDKGNFRNMLVGYHVNDDGYATDENGKVLEEEEKYGRGYLLSHDPDKLVLWDQKDKDGLYFDWKDPKTGKIIAKVHKDDRATIKELLTNYDMTINDPINNAYGFLAGIKEGDIKGKKEGLKYIGLDAYRTTIGRASTAFKEKNAAMSPMVAEMIKRGYIKNYAQEYLAYLDSLTKATKPGAWNVQDKDAVRMFAKIMDPQHWEDVFPTELIRGYLNVNGKPIAGTRIGLDGSTMKVAASEATRDELMRTVIEKFIKPSLTKMPAMTKRMTPNMIENQKPEVAQAWRELFEAIDRCAEATGINPYSKESDMDEIVRDVRGKFNGDGFTPTNHHVAVDEMLVDCNGSADEFALSFARYCDMYPDILGEEAKREFDNYARSGRMMTAEELHDFAISILDWRTYTG